MFPKFQIIFDFFRSKIFILHEDPQSSHYCYLLAHASEPWITVINDEIYKLYFVRKLVVYTVVITPVIK